MSSERSSLSSELTKAKRSLSLVSQDKTKLLDQKRAVEKDYQTLRHEKEVLANQRHNLQGKLQKIEADKKQLQEHVTFYKTNISAANRPVNEIADDIVKDKVENVFNSIQNFVVHTFRNAQFGMLAAT